MEKRIPHYRLAEVQKIVSDPASRPFTATALRGGLELGLTEVEMRQVVRNLLRRDFYKSMTTNLDSRLWQDVYHGQTEEGVAVYIKITVCSADAPPVIQFKRN